MAEGVAYIRKNPVTTIFLGLSIIYFLSIQIRFLGASTSAQAIYESGGLYGVGLYGNPQELWRLVTPMVIHIGWEHLIMNMVSLYFVGAMAEQLWGSFRYLLLVLVSGILGNGFAFLLTPDVVSAGASTAIFGLFAAIALAGRFGQNSYLRQVGQSYVTLLVINFIFSVLMPGVSLVGHLGGAVGGVFFASLVPSRAGSTLPKVYRVLAGFCLGIVFLLILWRVFVY